MKRIGSGTSFGIGSIVTGWPAASSASMQRRWNAATDIGSSAKPPSAVSAVADDEAVATKSKSISRMPLAVWIADVPRPRALT